jgi:hypothetical protein
MSMVRDGFSRDIVAWKSTPRANWFPSGELKRRIETFVGRYDRPRYHERADKLTPADDDIGRGRTILLERVITQTQNHPTPALALRNLCNLVSQ